MDEAKANHDRMMNGQGMAPEGVTITVEGGEWFFKPETIRVKQGQEVTIKLENVGSVPHDLKVGQFDAKTETVGGGSTTSVTFVADEVGEFPFWCTVPGHRSAGMEGTLIVE
jgi:nitrite reductase (NO-forming)